MKYRNVIGASLVLAGLFLVFNSSFGITGAVISGGFVKWVGPLVGLAFIVGGFVVFMTAGDLTEKINSVQKGKEIEWYITDKKQSLTNKGYLEIGEFEREVGEIGDDPELLGLVREAYVTDLNNIVRGGGEKSKLAIKCLETLGLKYEKDGPVDTTKYEEFLGKNGYLDNVAAKYLFDDNIPDSASDLVQVAKDCGYAVFQNEGDGNRVKDKERRVIITELGHHKNNNKTTQKGRLKDMASAKSSWRK